MGAIVNFVAVIAASLVGLLIKRGIPERISSALIKATALGVAYIGISGMLEGKHTLITVVSLALGAVIGTLIDIDKWLCRLSGYAENKINNRKQGEKKVDIASGFITTTLIFCVGGMTVVGSLDSGLRGNNTTLYAKSLLDIVTALIYSSTLGPGVLLSAISVLVIEGGLTLFAGLLAPLLTDTIINEMTCVGSIITLGLSLNLLKITDIKIANLLPAIFMPVLLCHIPILL